ncbi:MAG: hypothetical protein IAF02_22270 [Anaerolineae bacterium]|nr:hypothetical protein [Anaerolineae bacterium]
MTVALQNETTATLSTNGPGGIQAGFFPCDAADLTLYLLVPASSDVLFNLETETAVVITTPHWQLEGEAEVMPLNQAPPALRLVRLPQAAGCVLVSVICCRIHFNWTEGWGYRETIDCNGR